MQKRGVVVLAGGLGLRMGLVNKALLTLGDRPLIRHVVDRALKVSRLVVVVVGKDGDKAEIRRVLPKWIPVREDAVANKGPIAGFISGMKNLDATYVSVLPCDTPFINPNVMENLFSKAVGFDAAIPLWPNGYLETLQAVYKSSPTLEAAQEALDNNELSILDVVRRLRRVAHLPLAEIRRVDPGLLTFFNINTLEDLEKARHHLRKKVQRKDSQTCMHLSKEKLC